MENNSKTFFCENYIRFNATIQIESTGWMKSHIVYALSDALLLEETYFFGDNGADTSVFSMTN